VLFEGRADEALWRMQVADSAGTVAGSLALSGIFTNRLLVSLEQRRQEQDRGQALWLCRSALEAGLSGSREVPTPRGEARVELSGGRCEASLAGGRAWVEAAPYAEGWEATPAR